MTDQELKTLVLRLPGIGENYTYRMATLPTGDAEQVEQIVRGQAWTDVETQVRPVFGEPMNLNEAMHTLDASPDFTVVSPRG